ncbi:MAG: hypothetical protein HY822_13615 [Acidobacteria bacterium]|nr:hypothetical protein [Acidobacteriota bacterium]
MRFLPLIIPLVWLAGCRSEPERAPAIGEAFAGPASFTLREELHPRSAAVATVKHGDRLEILQRRRHVFRVRTAENVEGWAEARQLLAPAEMGRLRATAERAAQLPSQGRATVYDPLNIHTEPNRSAPSFEQIPEHGFVEVLGHQLAPRVPYYSPILSAGASEDRPVRKKPKKKDDERLPSLPMPKAPPPPPDWRELSKSASQTAPKVPSGAPMEDWSLVRTKTGKAGWVLTRVLVMAIPDEVAQYAEGHRITSYFSLGDVRDGENVKPIWLWTTLARTAQPYNFDSYRVFIWSTRRHRYETANIERNLEGYFPVTVQPVEIAEGRRASTVPGFSLIVREKDGKLARRTYAFVGQRARLQKRIPWTLPAAQAGSAAYDAAVQPSAPPAGEQKGVFARIQEQLNAWRRRWFKP